MITLLHSSRQCDFTDCDRAIFERIGVRSRRIYAAADRRDAETMFFSVDCTNDAKGCTLPVGTTGDRTGCVQPPV